MRSRGRPFVTTVRMSRPNWPPGWWPSTERAGAGRPDFYNRRDTATAMAALNERIEQVTEATAWAQPVTARSGYSLRRSREPNLRYR
jgi:hypothetical protein